MDETIHMELMYEYIFTDEFYILSRLVDVKFYGGRLRSGSFGCSYKINFVIHSFVMSCLALQKQIIQCY